jgi:hypothetical protein
MFHEMLGKYWVAEPLDLYKIVPEYETIERH